MVNCLVVDDNRTSLDICVAMLDKLGIKQVQTAVDGLEALRLCTESMPDVIILDWIMPNLDGIGFLTSLRKKKNGSFPYVIMCSGKGDEKETGRTFASVKSMVSGANSYINKPLTIEQLKEKLKEGKILE